MGSNHFFRQTSLNYHEQKPVGKIGIELLKPLHDESDLAKAYSPGVAYVVEEIIADPEAAYRYTNKSRLVAIISNGTAVLGLGNVGALASKPVMEGKAALVKALSGLDAIDIEINCDDPDQLIDTIERISPSFGGILLEDIKAPECFYIEQALQSRLNIPIFHDDQHGTAIVVTAALINGLAYQSKNPETAKVVLIGSGAAGRAVFDMLSMLGIDATRIFVFDRSGLIYKGRPDLPATKEIFATQSHPLSLKEAFQGADVVIGLSGPNLMDAEDLQALASNPLILALSNPTPEVDPSLVKQLRPDAILCTGRSDLENQVNNVVAFPYLLKSMVETRTVALSREIKWNMALMIAHIATQQEGKQLIPRALDPRLKNLTEMLIHYIKSSTAKPPKE